MDTPALEDLDCLFAPDARWLMPGVELHGPGQARARIEAFLTSGVTMRHVIGRLVEQGNAALCEQVAHNEVYGVAHQVRGAVVPEVRDGQIVRIAAYPDAND